MQQHFTFVASDTFGQEIKIELVIEIKSRDCQLYSDSFLILIGGAKLSGIT